MELVWVPGHHGIRGNAKVNECAVRGSSLDEPTVSNDFLIPLVVVPNKIDDRAHLTPAEYQGCFGILGHGEELRPVIAFR